MIKNYVLDTNILISYPNSILGFEDNNVWITGTTLQELDKKKTAVGEIGYNAREAIRKIEQYRLAGDLRNGVALENGGHLYIEPNHISADALPAGYSLDIADNRIISTVKMLSRETDNAFILVTNDISMRVNASVCGILVESYRNDHIASNEQEEYMGYREIDLPDTSVINALYANATCSVPSDIEAPVENEYFVLRCGSSSVLAIHRGGQLQRIPNDCSVYGLRPRNVAQTFALHALLAPVDEIPLVILKGDAGTGKTLLSMAAALDGVYDDSYHRKYDTVLISRSNATAPEEDLGALPGDIDAKVGPLLMPFTDALEFLLRADSGEDHSVIREQVEDLFETGTISRFALSYVRGRSFTNVFVVIDEAQNTSKTQMRDILTRAGKNCKVVILGDPSQIDRHNLDKRNNGLSIAATCMKGSPACAIITFDTPLRSFLTTEAIAHMPKN